MDSVGSRNDKTAKPVGSTVPVTSIKANSNSSLTRYSPLCLSSELSPLTPSSIPPAVEARSFSVNSVVSSCGFLSLVFLSFGSSAIESSVSVRGTNCA
jgi:hypothetical protein